MDINNLIETLSGAIALSSTVNAWTSGNYGSNVSVFENLDLRLLESPDACPMVLLHAVGKSGGPSRSKRVHTVAVEVLVYDELRFTDDNGVHVFRGGRNAEALRQLVFTEVKGAMPSSCQIDTVDTEYDAVDQFPFFWAGMQLAVSEENLIGRDPFE